MSSATAARQRRGDMEPVNADLPVHLEPANANVVVGHHRGSPVQAPLVHMLREWLRTTP